MTSRPCGEFRGSGPAGCGMRVHLCCLQFKPSVGNVVGVKALSPILSVVIPTVNEARELSEAVHRAQANPEVREVIVVDGGSRDGTPELAGQLNCRLLA